MGIDNMRCWICEELFDAETYGEDNQCPNCGQRYGYDEGQSIILTDAQLDILRNGQF